MLKNNKTDGVGKFNQNIEETTPDITDHTHHAGNVREVRKKENRNRNPFVD